MKLGSRADAKITADERIISVQAEALIAAEEALLMVRKNGGQNSIDETIAKIRKALRYYGEKESDKGS